MSNTTQCRSTFDAHVNSGFSERLEKALDHEAYPNCRCPFKCFTFAEETGFKPFHHLINGLMPSFVSFEPSFNSLFRGIRSDGSTTFNVLEKFKVSAFGFVHCSKGLVIGTCPDHHNGSNLQFSHPSTQPQLGRLSMPCEDSLTLIMPTLHQIKNAKAI